MAKRVGFRSVEVMAYRPVRWGFKKVIYVELVIGTRPGGEFDIKERSVEAG